MKKSLLIILAIFVSIICIVYVSIKNLQAENRELKRENSEYENYLNKEIYGTDLASLINKLIDHNEKNSVEKDSNGYYIDNNSTTIKLEVNMATIEKTYQMEDFYSNDITKFVQNFNQIKFRGINVKYNDLGKVNKIIFEEISEEIEK